VSVSRGLVADHGELVCARSERASGQDKVRAALAGIGRWPGEFLSDVIGRYKEQDAIGRAAFALLVLAALKSVIWAIVGRQVPDEFSYFKEIANIVHTGRTDLISGHLVGVFAYSGAVAYRLGGLLGIPSLLSVRLLGAVCTTLVAWMGYRMARLLSDGAFVPLATLVLVAFNPMYSFVGSSANSDTMQIMWATAAVLVALQSLVKGFTVNRSVLLFLFSVLVYVTKTPRIVLIVMVVVLAVIAAAAIRSRRLVRVASAVGRSISTPRGVAVLTLAAILGWAMRSRFLQSFTGGVDMPLVRAAFPWFGKGLDRFPSPAAMWTMWTENGHAVAEHLWGYFGRLHVPGPPAFYLLQYVILGVAAVGLVVGIARGVWSSAPRPRQGVSSAPDRRDGRRLAVGAAYAVLATTLIGTLAVIVEYAIVTSTMLQGRYLLLFVAPLYLLVSAAISLAVPRRAAGGALLALFALTIGANAWALLYIVVPYFY
jgi:hypothetical protein